MGSLKKWGAEQTKIMSATALLFKCDPQAGGTTGLGVVRNVLPVPHPSPTESGPPLQQDPW